MADKSVLFAKASGLGAATDTSLVAAVPGRRIRVMGLVVSAGAATSTVVLNSKPTGAGTAIMGKINLAINGGAVLNVNDKGWCETKVGEGLSITTTGTGPADVSVVCELLSA